MTGWYGTNDTHPKASKDHICCICLKLIKRGSKYTSRRGVFSRKLKTVAMHPECYESSFQLTTEQWENLLDQPKKGPAHESDRT